MRSLVQWMRMSSPCAVVPEIGTNCSEVPNQPVETVIHSGRPVRSS
jgi:hypothetical protein